MTEQVRYIDRESGEVRTELVFGERELGFLYHHPVGRRLTDLVVSRERVNRVYGWIQRGPWSRRGIETFVSKLGIDPGEAELPLEAYPSLDAFFTRRLRPGVRPIDPNPDHLLSPADGRVLVYPRLSFGGELAVKECRVTLLDLLQDPGLAERFIDGCAVVVRLAPADYHRFHFPASGRAGKARPVGEGLHSVHPIALSGGAPSFLNKRSITSLHTETFGELLIVEVGAMLVGTIVQTYAPGYVARGQEKGTFRMGGSTVIVLVEPKRVTLDEDLVANSARGIETFLKVRTRVAARSP